MVGAHIETMPIRIERPRRRKVYAETVTAIAAGDTHTHVCERVCAPYYRDGSTRNDAGTHTIRAVSRVLCAHVC